MSATDQSDSRLNESSVPPHLPEDSLASYNPFRTLNWIPAHEHASPDSPSAAPMLDQQPTHREAAPFPPCPDVEPAEPGEARHFIRRRLIGKGGFGEVWEAVQVSLNRVVAVKCIRKDVIEEMNADGTLKGMARLYASNFRQEALTTAQLAHPNIVPVYEMGRDESGSPLMAMKMIRGASWADTIIDDFPRMSANDFLGKHLPILVQVTQAVAYAHSRGVIHRDLKPAQVIAGEFGEVLLSDWGLAVVYNPAALMEVEQCVAGDFLPTPDSATNPAGTPAFMAPEQTDRTAARIGPWTDVYLLGGTLYYLLTGRPPHHAENSQEAFARARLGEVQRPEQIVPDREVPEDLSILAMQALHRDPTCRIESAKAFLQRLRDIQSGESRRRKSLIITEAVEERLLTEPPEYRLYAECLFQLSRAWGLWSDNPEVAVLRRKALAAMARTALQHGDLNLARLQAESIDTIRTRSEILDEITAAERRNHRRERQRRVAIYSVLILLFAMLASASIFSLRMSEERDHAREQRDRAMTARNDAQRLVNFMLTDLADALGPARQLEPLRVVGERVLQYFDMLPAEDMSLESFRRRAEALRTIGSVHLSLGDTSRALAVFREFQQTARAAYEGDPDSIEAMAPYAHSFVLIGAVEEEQGTAGAMERGLARALSVAADFIARTDQSAPSDGTTPEDYRMLARDLALAPGFAELGEDQNLVLNIAERLLAWKPDDIQMAHDLSYVFSWIGQSLADAGRFDLAERAFERGYNVRRRLLEEWPDDFDFRCAMFRSYYDYGRLYEAMNDMASSEDAYRQALGFAERSGILDSDDLDLRTGYSQGYRRLSAVLLRQEKLDEAGGAARHALETVSALAALDPQNAILRHYQLLTHVQAGRVALAGGEFAGAESHLRESLLMGEQLLLHDPRNATWRNDVFHAAETYIQIGFARINMGQEEEAHEVCAYIRGFGAGLPAELESWTTRLRQLADPLCPD